jgi:fermentation-respiration switch protein FrsA (DUF1100 family)
VTSSKTTEFVAVSTLAVAAALVSTSADAQTSKRVMFENQGQRMVGDLYLPADYAPGKKYPAVVVTGAWMTVKEQMPARYAAEMAARGYVALAFDFRNWGQSEGAERQLENPTNKTSDIVAAAAFLAGRSEVDPKRIGGLGICASAGYMAGATAASPHIRSFALVAPWLHDRPLVESVYGGTDGVNKLLATGVDAATRFKQTGTPVMALAASLTDSSAIMFKVPYYTERDRGQIPEWVNQFNLASWEGWLNFDAVALAPTVGQKPAAIVHSDAAAIPEGARRFYAKLHGPKSELWLPNVSQLDFYDRPEPVRLSSDFVAKHFQDTLK